MKSKILIHGGGGHAKVVLDALRAMDLEVDAVFDPKFTTGELMGVPFKGTYDPGYETTARIVLAIGSNHQRKLAAEKTAHSFHSAIHPSAILSRFSKVGEGSMILHGTIVQADARLGKHVIVNTGSSIDHDCVIEDFVHVAPKATLCGNVSVGEGTLVGTGAIVLPGIRIGKWAVVGAGSVVTKDVADNTTVAGNPARVIKTNFVDVP